MITQCCIQELYLEWKTDQAPIDLAKTFERRKCNHREAIPGDECLASVIGMCLSVCLSIYLPPLSQYPNAHDLSAKSPAGETNKHRYVVATQSQELRQKLRAIPAVPIVHVNRSVMILEPPSGTTLRAKALVSSSQSLVKACSLGIV